MENSVKAAFENYFARLLDAWRERFNSLPKLPFEKYLDSDLTVGEVDDNGLVEWQPLPTDERFASTRWLRDEIVDFFSSYYFLSAGGKFCEYAIQLNPIANSYLENIRSELEQYAASHDYNLRFVPIGVETQTGMLVVVNNWGDGPSVCLEDYEISEFTQISDSPFDLIQGLQP